MPAPLRRRPATAQTGSGGRPMAFQWLLLALFLILLGFFALLLTISNFDGGRQESVIRSIEERFAVELPEVTETSATTDRGAVPADQAAQESIAQLFERDLALARIDILRAGDKLRVTMPARELFEAGSATLREDRAGLLDRIARALADGPAAEEVVGAHRYVMHALFAGGRDDTGGVEATARASALARALRERGAPPGAVGVALAPNAWKREGEAMTVVLRFVAEPDPQGDAAAPEAGGAGSGS